MPLRDQLFLILHLSVAEMEEALVGEKPCTEGQKTLLALGCGRVRLVWYPGLLLKQGQVSQVLIEDNIFHQAAAANDVLEYRGTSVWETGQGVEYYLAWRYASQDGIQKIQILCELFF